MQILMHPSLYRNKCRMVFRRNGLSAVRTDVLCRLGCSRRRFVRQLRTAVGAETVFHRKRFSTIRTCLGQTCGRISRCRDRFDRCRSGFGWGRDRFDRRWNGFSRRWSGFGRRWSGFGRRWSRFGWGRIGSAGAGVGSTGAGMGSAGAGIGSAGAGIGSDGVRRVPQLVAELCARRTHCAAFRANRRGSAAG